MTVRWKEALSRRSFCANGITDNTLSWGCFVTPTSMGFVSHLVPVELAGDLVYVDAVADGTAVRAGGGEPAGEPAPYELLHLGMRELVAQFHGRVAGDGGEDVVFAAPARLGSSGGGERFFEGARDVPLGQS